MSDKYALIVGINYLGSPHILEGSWRAARLFKELLIEHFEYESDQIFVMTDRPECLNTPFYPGRINFLSKITEFLGKISADGVLLIYYCGIREYQMNKSVSPSGSILTHENPTDNKREILGRSKTPPANSFRSIATGPSSDSHASVPHFVHLDSSGTSQIATEPNEKSSGGTASGGHYAPLSTILSMSSQNSQSSVQVAKMVSTPQKAPPPTGVLPLFQPPADLSSDTSPALSYNSSQTGSITPNLVNQPVGSIQPPILTIGSAPMNDQGIVVSETGTKYARIKLGNAPTPTSFTPSGRSSLPIVDSVNRARSKSGDPKILQTPPVINDPNDSRTGGDRKEIESLSNKPIEISIGSDSSLNNPPTISSSIASSTSTPSSTSSEKNPPAKLANPTKGKKSTFHLSMKIRKKKETTPEITGVVETENLRDLIYCWSGTEFQPLTNQILTNLFAKYPSVKIRLIFDSDVPDDKKIIGLPYRYSPMAELKGGDSVMNKEQDHYTKWIQDISGEELTRWKSFDWIFLSTFLPERGRSNMSNQKEKIIPINDRTKRRESGYLAEALVSVINRTKSKGTFSQLSWTNLTMELYRYGLSKKSVQQIILATSHLELVDPGWGGDSISVNF